MIAGLGSLAFGSGAVLSSAAFNSSTDPTADLRVRVAEGLEVRAGQAFNDDGEVDTSNSNINEDHYIDPRDTGDTVGEDFYDGNELGPVFDDRDPPLATVSARSGSDSHAGINDELEIYVVPTLEEDVTFDDLLEIKNLGTSPVENVGIMYDRSKTGGSNGPTGQYGSDVTVEDDFDDVDYENEIGPLGVQRIFQFRGVFAGQGKRISPDNTTYDPDDPKESDSPNEDGLDNQIDPGSRADLRLQTQFPEDWEPGGSFGPTIDLEQTVRNVATGGNPFGGTTGAADLLDEITVGIEDPEDPFFQ